jgi:hypothetical protein
MRSAGRVLESKGRVRDDWVGLARETLTRVGDRGMERVGDRILDPSKLQERPRMPPIMSRSSRITSGCSTCSEQTDVPRGRRR